VAKRIVVGVDSSTQSTKTLAVDVDSGAVLGKGTARHTVSSGTGRESDPRQWWDALCKALADTEHAGQALAVSVAAQQHGLVTLDARGEPVRPALLWNDVRSAQQAEELVQAWGQHVWADRVGSVPTAAFTITKWAWLRKHDPEAESRTAAIRLPHDYLTERLSGAAVTDRGDASGTGWWTPAGYDGELIASVGLSPGMLPEVAAPGTQVGVVRTGTQLREGTAVATGTGDNMAAALGLGLRASRGSASCPVVSLGTSGTVYASTAGRPADSSGTVAGFADALGGWLPLACTLNCTLAVDRVASLLELDREAVEPGSETVMLPFFDGERTPNLPRASGLLYGLRHDTTPGQILQAAYDGAAHTLLTALEQVLAAGGAPPDRGAPLLLIGGGSKGTAWRQTVLRLSGRPVLVPAADELAALGAAAQAAGLITGEAADEVARRWGTAEGELLPAVPRDAEAAERIADTLSRTAGLQAGG
jgi:xylulokinase